MEKLVKSVNTIKQYYGGEIDEANRRDALPMPTKNERQECCKLMAESILSSPVKGNADYATSLGVTLETLLLCCQDAEADVRIAAEESINRIIKGTEELHFGKVLVEFYKEIKRNGTSRSLRAALVRFSNLAHRIRPSKCRAFVVSLIPAFVRICERNDDTIQECLAASVAKIFPMIGSFAAESEIQKLIDALMTNLSSNSAAIRRTSATCIYEVINSSSKKQIILSNVVNAILNSFKSDHIDSNFILGCLTALRHLIPLFATSSETIKRRTGSFGSDKDSSVDIVFDEAIAKVFELCTHFFCHSDSNIVTASLESLQALLKLPSESLKHLLNAKTLTRNDLSEILLTKLSATLDKGKSVEIITIMGNSVETTEAEYQPNAEDAAVSDKGLDDVEAAPQQKNDISSTPSVTKEDEQLTALKEDVTPAISESDERKHLQSVEVGEGMDSVKETSDVSEPQVNQESTISDSYVNKCEHLYSNSPIEVVSRLLCERILKIGSDSKKDVRVSSKNLALSCLGSILKFYPKIIFMSVLRSESSPYVSEILSYKSFYDPQIRACTILTISQYIASAMVQSKGNYGVWLNGFAHEDKQKGVSIRELVEVIADGLRDESVICTRRSIQAVKICFDQLMKSRYVHLGTKLLSRIVALKNTNYWLVKVDMLEIVAQINFRQILFAGGEITQEIDELKMFSHVRKLYVEITDIGLGYLADRDARVRNAAAAMLVEMVSNGGVVIDSYECNMATSEAAVDCKSFNTAAGSPASIDPSKKGTVKNLLKTYRGYEMPDSASLIPQNLSELVGKLSLLLYSSTSKHLTQGCITALLQLSNTYSISKHRDCYDCNFFQTDASDTPTKVQHTGIFPFLLSMLESAWIPLEITAHANVLLLAGNYLAGIACHGFHAVGVNPKIGENEALLPVKGSSSTEIPTSLSSILDKSIGTMAVKLFGHILKLISIFHHVITDAIPTVPNKSVLQTLQNTPSLPNTLKKKDKKDAKDTMPVAEQKQHKKTGSGSKPNVATEEVEKEKSSKASQNSPFSFAHSRLYMKVYELLLGAFESSKTTVDVDETDRFSTFLHAVLDVFCQILEITTFDDIEKYTEEILSYLRTTFAIEPTLTVQSVQQLLKSLFGTNLVSQWDLDDQIKVKSPSSHPRDQQHYKASFYHQVFHHPLNDLTMAIANASFHHYLQQENTQKASSGWFGSIKRKVEKKLTLTAKRSKGDKMSIQNYIRLFESIVIKSLKNYTMTSSVEFQKHVLNLLAQLVQLRVNYCLLDSDQIFIGFIVKQFEAIEGGMVRNSCVLIPHVFFFLVLLSYEKHHSKSVMTMPKIIQLCDGMMASGCDTVTHTIPALLPIVHDLFVLRAGMKHDNTSDLDTQHEVTQSMLFRIIEYPEVLSMVTTILQYYRKENPEQWKKYSRQVTDVLLPLISHLKLNISKHSDMAYLHSLFEALSPTALRPIDLVLNIFFLMPSDLSTISYHQRWIMKTVSLLRVLLCHLKEEYLLLRVREMEISAEMFSCKIFQILMSSSQENGDEEARSAEVKAKPTPEEVLSQSFLQIIGFTVDRMAAELFDPVNIYYKETSLKLLSRLLSEFLLTVTYICRSGSFKRLTIATKKILSQDADQQDENYYSAEQICNSFHSLSHHFPVMTVLWSQLLTCVGFTDLTMWGKLTGKCVRETTTDASLTSLNEGMVHQGSIIMLADYICQNQSEVEVMSWLIVNHIEEIISLHSEPPIQDFISAIHRSSSASGLFIESIRSLLSSRKRYRISFKKRILFCLRGLHLNQSDALLSLLLCDDWFVFSSMFAVSEFSDRMACDRVEMMLTQSHDSVKKEILIAQLHSLQPQIHKCESIPRFGRLSGLIKRLLFLLETGTDKHVQMPQKFAAFSIKNPDKNWYKNLVFRFVECSANSNEVAAAVNFLDYDDIVEVVKKNTFSLDCLKGCLSYALSEITRPDDAIARYTSDVTTPMLKAILEILKSQLQEFTKQFPSLKTDFVNNNEKSTFEIDHENYSDVSDYWKKVIVIFDEEENRKMVTSLCRALSECLLWQKVIKQPFHVFANVLDSLLRLGVSYHEFLIWTIIKGDKIDVGDQITCLEFMQQLLQNPEIQKIFYSNEKAFYSLTIANSLYALYGVLTGKIHPLPDNSNHFNKSKSPYSYLNEKSTPIFVIRKACELFDKLNDVGTCSTIAGVLIEPFKHSVRQILCHPVFNDLARVPPSLFKDDMKQREIVNLSKEPAAEYLQDKDMLKEFIGRINALGWINRMQFEETWTSLLGVLVSQPIGDSSQNATPVDETAIQISCLTINVLTALVMNTCMKPQGGQLITGAFQNIPRTTVAALPDSKIGHELRVIQCTIEQELANVVFGEQTNQLFEYFQLALNTLHVVDSAIVPSELLKSRLTLDLERRVLKPLYYGIGQRSVRSFRMLHDISPLDEDTSEFSSDDENFITVNSSDDLNSETSEKETNSAEVTQPPPRPRIEQQIVDAHSCVQFLIDLFSEWFRSSSVISPTQQSGNVPSHVLRLPRQFLCECLHSLILVSDFFKERQQFEWMFNALNSLQIVHPHEDDIMLQYLVLGMCKASAVLGINKKACEIIQGLMESALASSLLSCHTFALYGALYILECELREYARPLITLLSKFVCDRFKNINNSTVIHSQQLLRNVISVGFYLIEKWQVYITPAHTKTFVQGTIALLSSTHSKDISGDLYITLMRSLENLITSYSLSASDCDAIAKLSIDQFGVSESRARLLTSLDLTVTCMYFRMMRVSEANSTEDEIHESKLLSMEKCCLMFDKIKTSNRKEAEVIVRILPTLLDRFFSTQDMMNKVIGEFVSSFHPFPELIATILHRVFQILHSRGEGSIVTEWVMLSLGNFTQKAQSAAIWCLTCIFLSASTNHWINSLLPLVLSEMHLTSSDYEKFYVAAIDFYTSHLSIELDRRSFHSIFKAVAKPDSPYQIMLDTIEKLDTESN